MTGSSLQKGFTLIEMIVTIAIFTLLMAGVGEGILMLYKTQTYAFQQAQAIDEARRSMKQLVQEIRAAHTGADGSYLLQTAGDYELVFYSDITHTGTMDKVRYFIKPSGTNTQQESKDCTSFTAGGSCSVAFSNFFTGTLQSASIQVSAEGDLNNPTKETVAVSANGTLLATLCKGWGICGQCVGAYQDLHTFNVVSEAANNLLQVTASGSSNVDPICNWQSAQHSIKAHITLLWTSQLPTNQTNVFQKQITAPTGWPPTYSSTPSQAIILSNHIRNEILHTPVFTYYDTHNQLLTNSATRAAQATRVHIQLIVNVNPNKAPRNFDLESDVQIRNLSPSS